MIAPGAAEPSGDDRSLIVFESAEPVSRDRVGTVLAQNGLEPARTLAYDDPNRPGTHLYLTDVTGFVALDDARVGAVRRALPAAAVWLVGAYATPLGAGH